MNCPKCQANMEPVTFNNVTVDRCTGCSGIWFDFGEIRALHSMKGAVAIDSGNPRAGKKMDEMTEINCPKCNVKMTELVDTDQHHIHLENCPSCKGTFLDAGEFRDLQHYTIVDYVRGLFTKTKKKK